MNKNVHELVVDVWEFDKVLHFMDKMLEFSRRNLFHC